MTPDFLADLLLMTYVGKLCVFCGVALTLADLDNAVRANEPPEPVELAHEECYNKYSQKGERDELSKRI